MKPSALPASRTGQWRACWGSRGRVPSRRGLRPIPGRLELGERRTSMPVCYATDRLSVRATITTGPGAEFMNVRRVATGHTADGKSVVVSDTEVDGDTLGLFHLWGADRAPRFPDDGSEPPWSTFFPPVGGYRFGLFTVRPESDRPAGPSDREARLG